MITLQATQLSNSRSELSWITDDPDPVAGFEIRININLAGDIGLATVSGTGRGFVDLSGLWIPGDSLEYTVIDQDTATPGSATILAADLDEPYTYGVPQLLATAPRYTSLERVKARLGADTVNPLRDQLIEEAIIACEASIDLELDRSFPDQGTNPELAGVPMMITTLATSSAIAVYKQADAPFGRAGADEWLGSISVADVVSQTIRRSPLIRGLQITFGIG